MSVHLHKELSELLNENTNMFQNMQGILHEKIHTVFILIYNDSTCQTTPFLHKFKFKKNLQNNDYRRKKL
jgi:hypothetical protein